MRRPGPQPEQRYADSHQPDLRLSGGLREAITGADVFIGTSVGGRARSDLVRVMAPNPIVFALANPEPEVQPEAIEGLAAVIATGRSDYPNQINNVLCFPGFFRGLLDSGAAQITDGMKLAAARRDSGCRRRRPPSRVHHPVGLQPGCRTGGRSRSDRRGEDQRARHARSRISSIRSTLFRLEPRPRPRPYGSEFSTPWHRPPASPGRQLGSVLQQPAVESGQGLRQIGTVTSPV